MRTFHVHLLFQAATEIYSNHRAINDKTHTTVVPFNLSVSSKGLYPFEETDKQTKTNKNLSHD